MAKKTPVSGFDDTISRIARPSVFDRIVKEIDTKEIPPRYVDTVIIQYQDGTVTEIPGSELKKPISMNKPAGWDKLDGNLKKMRDVRVLINITQLEKDINAMVETILGKYC